MAPVLEGVLWTKGGVRRAAAGGLRTLWSGACWSQERQHRHGLVASPACLACGAPQGTLGHELFDCAPLLACHGEEEEPPFSEAVLATREFWRDKGFSGFGACWDRFDITIGLPIEPSLPAPVPDSLPTEYWGDWSSDRAGWGGVVYTDGSGFGNRTPEGTRCGLELRRGISTVCPLEPRMEAFRGSCSP